MYRSAVNYKGVWLAPGSRAEELYRLKQFKELDAHIKALDQKERNLLSN